VGEETNGGTMSYEKQGAGALDYLPCRYGNSKLLFRGPRRRVEGDYIAVLGGTDTYGKFIERPYAALIEQQIGMPTINLGCVNAGPDVFVNDPKVLDICGGARTTVIQVMGAHNMSNRFYAVHPRRNDRFLKASSLMKTVFRDLDFTEFHFTRHMLSTIKERWPDRFEIMVGELQDAWVARMSSLLGKIEGKTVLLWMSKNTPDEELVMDDASLGTDPLFVNRTMIEAVRPLATDVVEVNLSLAASNAGTDGMAFSDMEAVAAKEVLSVKAHQETADELSPILRYLTNS
jgi:hypothetical protein